MAPKTQKLFVTTAYTRSNACKQASKLTDIRTYRVHKCFVSKAKLSKAKAREKKGRIP